MIRQCPRCDLRFRAEGELTEHLSVDHDADVGAFERYRYPAARAESPLYADLSPAGGGQPRRILVVANQTLVTDTLIQVLLERLAAEPVELLLVVPATHSHDYRPVEETRGLSPTTDERGKAQARWRLRQAMEALRSRGVVVTGEIGPPDPYEAVGQVLERQPVDEVVIGTLPPGVSRWFMVDVPERIRRRFGIPVHVVTAEPPTPVEAG